MRLALVVISSAAFGRALPWKDVEFDPKASVGHTMTFSRSLSGLANDFVLRILLPKVSFSAWEALFAGGRVAEAFPEVGVLPSDKAHQGSCYILQRV